MILPYFVGNLGMGGGGSPTPTGPATIREAVRARLAETTDLTAKVGGRIYFYALPQSKTGTSFPAVTFYVSGRDFDEDLDGPNAVCTSTVRISCWSRTELEAAAMADVVRQAFHGFQGLWGQVDVMYVGNPTETDLPEYPRNGDDVYTHQTVLTFDITHRISIPVFA